MNIKIKYFALAVIFNCATAHSQIVVVPELCSNFSVAVTTPGVMFKARLRAMDNYSLQTGVQFSRSERRWMSQELVPARSHIAQLASQQTDGRDAKKFKYALEIIDRTERQLQAGLTHLNCLQIRLS